MARTTISKNNLAGGSSVGVGFAEHTWTAADASNYNAFASTGKEILLVRNTNADSPVSSHMVTLHKTNGKVQLSIASGEYWCSGQIPQTGWKQSSDSNVWVDADSAEVEFSVLVMP